MKYDSADKDSRRLKILGATARLRGQKPVSSGTRSNKADLEKEHAWTLRLLEPAFVRLVPKGRKEGLQKGMRPLNKLSHVDLTGRAAYRRPTRERYSDRAFFSARERDWKWTSFFR